MSTNEYILIAKTPLNPSEIESIKNLFENKNFRKGKGEVFKNIKYVLNELNNYETLEYELYSVDNMDGLNKNNIKIEFLIKINLKFIKTVQQFARVVRAYKEIEIAKMNLRDKLSEFDDTNPKDLSIASQIAYASLECFSEELFDEERSIEREFENFLSEHCIKSNEQKIALS